MRSKMALTKDALLLFLLSLPLKSKFNICSFGSTQHFLFDDVSSVSYNKTNTQFAIEEVEKFRANLGGLDIYTPLKTVLEMESDCTRTDIFLLTDGAVSNTDQIIDLIEAKSSQQKRVHTFGLGKSVDEKLIKKCASKGFGNYYLIKDMKNLEY